MKQGRESFTEWLWQAYALGAFACAMPLLGFLSNEPDFFVAHQFETIDLFLLLVLVFLLPAITMFLCLLFCKSEQLSRKIPVSILALLFSLALFSPLKAFSYGWVAALFLGVIFFKSYSKVGVIRKFLVFCGPVALLMPVYFLALTPLKRLITIDNDWFVQYPNIKSNTPVVMLLLDELPLSSLLNQNLEIDQALFPHFYQLASQATWFSNATTVADHTTRAVPAIITGLYPDYEKTAKLKDYPENMFTLLGKNYEMHIEEPRTQLCPDRFCDGHDQGFLLRWRTLLPDIWVIYQHVILPDTLLSQWRVPKIGTRWGGFTDKKSMLKHRDVEQFLEKINGPVRPVFYFLHVELPHSPWIYLPSGRYYDNGDEDDPEGLVSDGKVWIKHEWPVLQAHQRHLLQLMFTDKILGETIAKLKKTGLYEDALLVVVADHGINFVPGEFSRGLNQDNIDALAPVPLFIKLPHQTAGERDTRPVETIDIFPSMVEALGISVNWTFDGENILGSAETGQRSERKIFHSNKAVYKIPNNINDLLKPLVFQKYLKLKFSSERGGVTIPSKQDHWLGQKINLSLIDQKNHDLKLQEDFEDPLKGSLPLRRAINIQLPEPVSFSTMPVFLLQNGEVISVSTAWRREKNKTAPFRVSFLLPEESLSKKPLETGVLVDIKRNGKLSDMAYVPLATGS